MARDRDLEAVGREIRRQRINRDLSQEALAERADLHRNYVGMLERGERNPSATTLVRLARALGIPVADLFREVDATSR